MKLRAFTKTYGGVAALRMPETELMSDGLCAVIGANGSGKSTLARLLAGTETPDDGRAVVTGLTVGYMPQRSYGFRMSVRANLLLGGGDPTRAEELMRALGIDSLASKAAHRLSGGETARLALARVLMRDCDLYILDEPTASMDMESTLLAEELIRSRCQRALVVTHSLGQARRISDEALFLKNGELIERGESKRLLYEPETEEARRFLQFYV